MSMNTQETLMPEATTPHLENPEICSVTEPHPHESAQAIGSLDNLGIVASTICLIHCLAMPFVMAMLPMLGWQFLEGKSAHFVLAAFVVSFALLAIVPGYFKHKHTEVLLGMILG